MCKFVIFVYNFNQIYRKERCNAELGKLHSKMPWNNGIHHSSRWFEITSCSIHQIAYCEVRLQNPVFKFFTELIKFERIVKGCSLLSLHKLFTVRWENVKLSNCFEKFLGKNGAFEQKIHSVAFTFGRKRDVLSF